MRIIINIILISMFAISCREQKVLGPYKTGMEGKHIPLITLQLTDNKTHITTTDWSPKTDILLFYFGSKCQFSRAQMRDMLNSDHFKNRTVYAICSEDIESIKQFADYFELDKYPNVTVARDTGLVISQKFRVRGVPFTAYYDQQKKLISAYSGRMNSKTLRSID